MAARKYPKVKIGDKFGNWTVIGLDARDKHHRKVVTCKCECGNKRNIAANLLHSKRSTSCGCHQWDWRKDMVYDTKVKVGEQYHYLTVIQTGLRTRDKARRCGVLCRCHCNKELIVGSHELMAGQKSCGCMDYFKEYTGQKFGKLTVVKYIGKKLKKESNPRGRHDRIWQARCDCGNLWEGRIKSLVGSEVISCGCAKIDNVKRGPEHPAYRYDLTEEDRILRGHRHYLTGYEEWQKEVRSRYNYRCCICDSSQKIECHHLDGFRENIERATDVNNGVLLCKKCHSCFHKTYGKKNITKSHFLEFYKNCTGNNIVL